MSVDKSNAVFGHKKRTLNAEELDQVSGGEFSMEDALGSGPKDPYGTDNMSYKERT